MSAALETRVDRRRIVIAYAAMAVVLTAACLLAFSAGGDRQPAPAVGGTYAVTPAPCGAETIVVQQSGQYLSATASSGEVSSAELVGNQAHLDLRCPDGSQVAVVLAPAGGGAVTASVAGAPATAIHEAEVKATAKPVAKRSGEETFGRLMAAMALVILAARLTGAAVARIGQPQVMGEVLAGIALGPTLLGAVAPEVQHALFPPDIVPLLSAGADIGLAFYMFLVGLELEPRSLRGRVGLSAVVSNASVALPLSLGLLVAVPLYPRSGRRATSRVRAVHGRLDVHHRLPGAGADPHRTADAGALGASRSPAPPSTTSTAWGLLALARAVARRGRPHVAQVSALAVLFVVG